MASWHPGRLAGAPLLALLFVLSLSISVYHFFIHEVPLLPTILGQWSMVLLSLGFGAVGWYALDQVETDRQRYLIGVHGTLMFGIAGLATAVYESYQYLSPAVSIPLEGILFEALFVALIAGMIGTAMGLEVARREQALADLQLERDKFSKLFENIPDPAVEYELDDGKMVLVRGNDAFVDEFGIEPPVSVSEFNQAVAGLAREGDAEDLDRLVLQSEEASEEVLRQTVTGRRWFKVHSASHRDGGFVLYLDITEQYLRGQQIQVLSRVLRHNIRNNLTVARGYAEKTVRETERDDLEANAEKVRSAIEELLEIAERTKTIREQLEDDPPKPERSEITAIVRNRITDLQQSFPDVEFTLDAPDELWAQAHPTLGVVIDVLVETLVENNDQPRPQIALTVESVTEQGAEYVVVRIVDTGTTLSDQELIPLRTGKAPSKLRHASDIDLWMANWFVDQFGGVLDARASEAEGTTLQIRLETNQPKSN